ncbi:MAG TPA: hypothetical protein DDX85_02915 [Nitrospiraceae bacterium]|nr:hypothetical protein [Nitrospiraceae bacterium]
MDGIANLEARHDESIFKGNVNEAINRMLACMLHQEEKCCKKCNDVSVCSFLTEAVVAYKIKKTITPSV